MHLNAEHVFSPHLVNLRDTTVESHGKEKKTETLLREGKKKARAVV